MYTNYKTDDIYKEALKSNFSSAVQLIDIKQKSNAIIVLKASLLYPKDKTILTSIIEEFNEDKDVVDFYTKYQLWKHVDFNVLNKLTQYGMTL